MVKSLVAEMLEEVSKECPHAPKNKPDRVKSMDIRFRADLGDLRQLAVTLGPVIAKGKQPGRQPRRQRLRPQCQILRPQ